MRWGELLKTSLRSRPGAVPELRLPADDHCGLSGTAGHRNDPHAPGNAGARTASCGAPWLSAAIGLTLPNRDCSGGPATRAAGVGCVRAFSGPMAVARRQGVTLGRRQREAPFDCAVNAQQNSVASKQRSCKSGAVFCRVWGAVKKEEARLKNLSSHRINPPHALPALDLDGLLPRPPMLIVEYLVETFAQVPLLTADR